MINENIDCLIELNCTKSEHTMINSATLALSLQSGAQVLLIATRAHRMSLQFNIDKFDLRYTNYFHSNYYPYKRKGFFFTLVLVARILTKVRRCKSVTFLSVNVQQTLAIYWLSKIISTNIRVIPHAILEQSSVKNGVLEKILFFRRFPYWIKKTATNSDVTIVFLSKSIKNNFEKEYVDIITNYEISEHPFLFHNNTMQSVDSISGDINVGFIGVGTSEKGLDWLIGLLNKSKNEEDIKYHLIGENKTGLSSINLNEISGKYLSQERYDFELRKLNYIIFPFNPKFYKLRASGSLFDALANITPIITTNNAFIIEHLNKYNIKYIMIDHSETLEQINEKIRAVSEEEYREMVFSIKRYLRIKINQFTI
jgi:glycosyltransferase involved in cell wall biosynthesis